MAILVTPENKIKSSSHCNNAIEYAVRPEKAMSVASSAHDEITFEYTTRKEKMFKCSTRLCSQEKVAENFSLVRKMFDKDNGILIQHYIISFSPEEKITPQEAHDIALEWVDKCAVGHQVLVSTHIDREHIHNHVYINNCNLMTGKKFYDNKTSLAEYRNVLDGICLAHNKSIIETTARKYVNRSSRETESRGISYKEKMCQAVDKALIGAKSFSAFQESLKESGYVCRIGKYITITESANENHRCRTDTLARQFGEQYKAENIYRALNEAYNYEKTEPKSKSVSDTFTKSNYDASVAVMRKRGSYFALRHSSYLYDSTKKIDAQIERCGVQSMRNGIGGMRNPDGRKSAAKLLASICVLMKMQTLSNRYKYTLAVPRAASLRTVKVGNTYCVSRHSAKDLRNHCIGDVDYNTLLRTTGETICAELPCESAARVLSAPFLNLLEFNNSESNARIYFKKQNKAEFEKVVGVQLTEGKTESRQADVNEAIINAITARKEPLQSAVNLTMKQVAAIKRSNIECAIYANADSMKAVYSLKNESKIRGIICKEKGMTGNVPYSVFKKYVSFAGVKPSYWKMTTEQYSKVRQTESGLYSVVFATDDGRQNLVYLPEDREKIHHILYEAVEDKVKFVSDIRKRGGEVCYRTVSESEENALIKSGINVMVSASSDAVGKYIAAYDSSERNRIEAVISACAKAVIDAGAASVKTLDEWNKNNISYAWKNNISEEKLRALLNEDISIFYVRNGSGYSVAYQSEDEAKVRGNLGRGTAPIR